MHESVAKRVVRVIFYDECVGEWLNPEEIEDGNILILMGDAPREISYIDNLGFSRFNVCSVERDPDVYRLQVRLDTEQELNISLYQGSIKDYLMVMLHQFGKFVVLNLDIEGGYRLHLDPSMTSVVQFCCASPRTVVATYSSVGRDIGSIQDGIRSLSLLIWLAPKQTRELMGALEYGYAQAGSTQPVRFVLRDMFWIASQIEHLLQASMLQGHIASSQFEWFCEAYKSLWKYVAAQRQRVLRVKHLYEAVVAWKCAEPRLSNVKSLPRLPLRINELMHVYYNARYPWSQRCYFVRYEMNVARPLLLKNEIAALCQLFIDRPFVYVDREGARHDIDLSVHDASAVDAYVLWRGMDLYDKFRPRILRPGVMRRTT